MVYWAVDITLKTNERYDLVHIDPSTGRQFRARRIGKRFFLEEIIAVGVWMTNRGRWLASPSQIWMPCPPNRQVRTLCQYVNSRFPNYLEREDVVVVGVGSGFLPDSQLLMSLADCSRQIVRSIRNNTWYLPSDANPTYICHKKNVVWVTRLLSLKSRIDWLYEHHQKLQCLTWSSIDKQIQHYLENPSESLWNRIALCTIAPELPVSIWEAWRRVDPSAPDTQPRFFRHWKKIPSPQMLRAAIVQLLQHSCENLGNQIHMAMEQYRQIRNLYSIRLASPKILLSDVKKLSSAASLNHGK